MKQLTTLFLFVFLAFTSLQAQVPSGIPYQAIARDASGAILASQAITVKFRIYDTFTASSESYEENQAVTTSAMGYFNLFIGKGTAVSGSFSAINWSTGDVSYEIYLDAGLGFQLLGSRSNFMSVPYALYAGSSASGGSGNYQGGTGIAISSNTITNTAPDQTVTMTGAGNTQVTGTYPNFTVSSPAQQLSLSSNTISLSNGGGSVVLPATSVTPPTSITTTGAATVTSTGTNTFNIALPAATAVSAGAGMTVSGTSPNFTVTNAAPDQVVSLSGTGNAAVTGTYPNYTVNTPAQQLSLSSNTISLSNGGGNVVLPVTPTTTLSAGTGIALTGTAPNYTVTNAAPNQSVSLNGGGNAAVTGAYPNYTVNAPAQVLSLSSNTISLSNGGGNVVLPVTPTTTLSAGTGITLTGTAPNYTVTNAAPNQSVALTGGGNTAVTGAYPNYTVSAPAQVLSLSTNTISLSNGGGNVVLPVTPTTTLTSGAGITLSGTAPHYTVASTVLLPAATANGNTLRWNSALPGWKESSTLFNDDQHIGIGLNSGFNGLLHVGNAPASDASAIYAEHTNGQAGTAAFRAFASGSSTAGMMSQAVFGGDFKGSNSGQGPGVGLMAVGDNNISGGSAYGIYATTTGAVLKRWAGYFDQGGVMVNDSLVLGSTVTPGNTGDVMTRTSSGRLVWTNPNSLGIIFPGDNLGNHMMLQNLQTNNYWISNDGDPEGIWIKSDGKVGIGTTAPGNTFAVGNGALDKLNISGTTGGITFSDDQGSVQFPIPTASAKPMFILAPSGTSNPARMIFASSPSLLTTGLQFDDVTDRYHFLNAGTQVMTIDLANQRVGVGNSAPTSKLTVGGDVEIPAANTYKYTTAKTQYYGLAALAFNPEGTYNRAQLGGGVYILDGTAGTQGNLYAGVNLPDGAVVIAVDAYVVDNDATAGRDLSYVQLWRQDGAVGTAFGNSVMLAQTTGTSGASSVIQKISTSSITSGTIDNANYAYYIRVGSFQNNSNIMLFKVVITYTVTRVN